MRMFGIAVTLAAIALTAPAAWAQRGPGRGGFDGGGLMLLSQKSVQEELKLSEDQVKQLDEQLAKQREAFGELRDLSREERQQRMAAAREQNQKTVSTLLNDEQQKRYRQIMLQVQGGQALGAPDVSTALGLSDDQKKSIEEIQTAAREEMRSLFQDADGDREAMRKKFQEARQATDEKIKGVLTADQKTKWQEMLGEPFKGELRGPGGPGGPGQGPRRRQRDGAAMLPADPTPTVLTADREDDSPKADKPRGEKKEKQARKPRHHHHAKARHHRGPRQPVSLHARHRGRTRGGQAMAHRRPRDPRRAAWDEVARAMGRRPGPGVFSHRDPHRLDGQFARFHHQPRHFAGSHPRFHGDFAQFRHHGPRPGFSAHRSGPHRQLAEGRPREFARGPHFADFRHHGPGPRPHGHPRHADWHGGHGPMHGPVLAHRPHGSRLPREFAHRDRGEMAARHHGPPLAHARHHGHGRMHMAGFKREGRPEHRHPGNPAGKHPGRSKHGSQDDDKRDLGEKHKLEHKPRDEKAKD